MRHSHLFFVGVVAIIAMVPLSTSYQQAKEGCQDTCGNLTIPYPFGTSEDCYHDPNFLITCDTSLSAPKPFLTNSNIEVTNISLHEGNLIVMNGISYDCYYKDGSQGDKVDYWINLSKFKVSDSLNMFTVVGCDVHAIIIGYQGNESYASGCTSFCSTYDNVSNGSCSGVGCCQTLLPNSVNHYKIHVDSYYNHTNVWNFNPCGYAFVVEENKYNFSFSDFQGLRHAKKKPFVVDWAIGNETCDIAQKSNTYACGSNSICLNTTNGSGYRCSCFEGYEGNPYLPNSCQDIDECQNKIPKPCQQTCTNTAGNYTCSCYKGYSGTGDLLRNAGDVCIHTIDQSDQSDQSLAIKNVLGTVAGVTILLVASAWVYLILKKRKLIRLKEKFFRQNGGVMLQQQLSNRREKSTETVKMYTAEELKKATESYADSRIIGKGGYGTVYRGVLADDKIVAIKKSTLVDQSQIEQFINEVIVLSQINHRNVVKLLGCCLETEVPLLVYEFISNGTLYDHVHNRRMNSILTWDVSLRIAIETAGVLWYLHSAAFVPIIHRDVKSTNILLDENYTAKVSDFGASRLVPLDEMQLSTMVQGTLGYLDPEYLQTSQLTEKSDVYSFGVVLVELLTRRHVLCFQKPENERSLSTYFISSLKEGRLFQILDARMVQEGGVENLKSISNLAKRCLSLRGEGRPTMKEVWKELEGLKNTTKHSRVSDDYDETRCLLEIPSETFEIESTGEMTVGYDTITEQMALAEHRGR